MREETLIDFYAASNGSTFDAEGKRLFTNREIIAPILQMVVPEYKECTVQEVMRCIDAESIDANTPVDDIPVKIKGLPTELSSVTDKLIIYDVHFKALNPVLSNEKISVNLHINFELQNKYKPAGPSYPLVKRALYYAVRELSAQLGSLTETTDYSALEKVYSIWICNEGVPPELTDTVTGYSIRRDDIIGTTNEPEEDFDLLNVIMIRRGGMSREKIFKYLTGVYNLQISEIEKYTPISSNKKLVQEVESMAGFAMSFLERGYEQGEEQANRKFVERMLAENEPVERITLYTGCSVQDVLKIKEQREKEMQEDGGRNNARLKRPHRR